MAAVAAARLGTVTEASVSIDCTEPATTNGPAVFFFKNALLCRFISYTFFFSSGLSINTCSRSLQFPPSLAVEASVMQHLQYGKKTPSQNLEISNSLSFASFKRKNKTYYFSCTFSWTCLAIFPASNCP